jgi:hypothetical protein
MNCAPGIAFSNYFLECTGIWTQSFILAKKAFYLISPLFFTLVIWDWVSLFPQSDLHPSPPIYASHHNWDDKHEPPCQSFSIEMGRSHELFAWAGLAPQSSPNSASNIVGMTGVCHCTHLRLGLMKNLPKLARWNLILLISASQIIRITSMSIFMQTINEMVVRLPNEISKI